MDLLAKLAYKISIKQLSFFNLHSTSHIIAVK